ncbi:MAG: hypothetical protein KGY76_01555 [Candidatus Thermoplasmatota archaeon]|nr:hypothetical protein [Candidatus Thermoplasmatota archaeon]
MPVDKIIEKIKEDVDGKIDSIMEEKKEEAEEVKEDIEQEKERKLEEIRKEKEREINTMKNRILSQAKLEKRKKKLSIREKMIERVFEKAEEKLAAMDPEEYEDYLRKAIGRSTNILPGEVTIICESESEEEVKKLAKKIDPSLRITTGLDSIGGIKAKSEEGSTIDLTFEANIERRKKELRKEISDILFPEE